MSRRRYSYRSVRYILLERWRLRIVRAKRDVMFAEIDALAKDFDGGTNDIAKHRVGVHRWHDDEVGTSTAATDNEKE
jgi:hypothetical protein